MAEHCTINSRLNASCPNSFATCNGPLAGGIQMLIPHMPREKKLIVLFYKCRSGGCDDCPLYSLYNSQMTRKISLLQLPALLPADRQHEADTHNGPPPWTLLLLGGRPNTPSYTPDKAVPMIGRGYLRLQKSHLHSSVWDNSEGPWQLRVLPLWGH